MFAQRVRTPQHKVSAPAKESPRSESAKLETAPETVLTKSPAYSYSLAGMPILPPSDPPPNKPALQNSFASAPPIVHQVLNTPGQPLHSATRAFFEPRFGYDFSRIRVHTDAQAEASADAIQARAYTSGNRIVFASGQYGHSDPDRTQLLAHELAHVIQQGRPEYSATSRGSCEQDAENAAASILSGNAAAVRTSAAFGTVQRQAVTNPTGTPATQKKSRMVRVERYWRSPSARAIYADGSTEEVTFVEASSLDPANQPAATFEKEANLTIDRSSTIRPHVEFASHSSGSKVKVVTRLAPADRISKLPPSVRGELSESFLSDTENGSNPETMEFVADIGDRLKETSGTTKIEMEGRDPATLAVMQAVDQWVPTQQKTIDKLGPERLAKFTKLMSDIRTVGVTGPTEAEDLNAREIELVVAGAAGGQSEFKTFSEFRRGMDRKLHSKEISIPEEMADNPDFFIRNEYRKAWKTEAAGLDHMSRIASAAQAAPFIALGASAVIGGGLAVAGAAAAGASEWLLANGVTSGTSALEIGGEKTAEWLTSQGISSGLAARWVGSSLLAYKAVNQFGASRDEAKSVGVDPNSPVGIANTLSATILRTSGLGEMGESLTDRSIQTQLPLNQTFSERVAGFGGGALDTLGAAGLGVPESPNVAATPAPRPIGASSLPGAALAAKLKFGEMARGVDNALELNIPSSSVVEGMQADSAAGNAGPSAVQGAVTPDPAISPDLPSTSAQTSAEVTPQVKNSSIAADGAGANAVADPLAGAVQRPLDITGGSAFDYARLVVAQLSRSIVEADQRYQRRRDNASEAEKNYANSVRNKTSAKQKKGDAPTQQEQDLLATKKLLATLRDNALAKLNQLKKALAVLQPQVGAQQHGKAGLAEEPKHITEAGIAGLALEQTDPGMPVIDAASVKTPELHSVKTLVQSQGSAAAIESARGGSPLDLARRVGGVITKALVDRRSDKWNRLRNQWNNTKRARYADHFGYEIPKNRDDIKFVVGVRVVTANPLSADAQKAVEEAVKAWLSKNERVPPGFSWIITYVPGGTQ
jgi:hypothetical protein